MAFRSSNPGLGPSAGSVVFTKPLGVVSGDMLIISVVSANDTVTFPSGFTAFPTLYTTSGGHSRAETWAYAWKLAGGAEPSTYTVSVAAFGAEVMGVMGAWSGRASIPGSAVVTDESGFSGTGTFTSTLTGYTANAGDDICVLTGVAAVNTGGTWATTTSGICTISIDQNGVFGGSTSGNTGLAFSNNLGGGATGNLVFTETLSSGTGTLTGEGAGVVIQLPAFGAGNTATIAWVS
jgi:hypothetical protein